MASVVTNPSPDITVVGATKPLHAAPESSASVTAHGVPARDGVHMGRAATRGAGLNWTTTVAMVIFHIGAIAGLFFLDWQRILVAVVLYVVAINVGIGMCYHRLLTHRGYQVPKWLEYVMTICATLALEGGPIFWVATHRVHHQLSDHEGDPHTPREGGWWAHAGWIFFGAAMASETSALGRYVPDLTRHRFYVWLSKYHWIPLAVSGALLFAGGWYFGGLKNGIAMLLVGGFLRVTLGLHTTWLTNSVTHMWGSRRFKTRDDSRNNLWVALVTGGEGWHNNHHAHPVSARHGLKWYEIDPNFWGIWILARLGLARKVRVAQYDPADPKPAGV